MADLGTHAGCARCDATTATGDRIFKATTGADAAGDAKANQTFELTAGASIVIHFRTATTGAGPPGGAQTVTVTIFEDNSTTVVRTFTAADPAVDEDFTFFATSDGTAGGTPRAGTYRVRVRGERTSIGTYDVNSDDAGTPPAGGGSNFGKGYLRGGTTMAAFVYSDVALGGAAPANNRFVYPKSQFLRSTLGSQVVQGAASVMRDVTVSQRQAGAEESTNTVAASLANPALVDVTRTGGVGAASGINNDFLIADTDTAVRLVAANSAMSGQPWVHFTSIPGSWTGTIGGLGAGFVRADSPTNLYKIDPRITFTQLLQANDGVYGTPPSSKNIPSGQRLATDLGFIAARATDAHGAGINALAWTEKLWDNGNLVSSEGSPAKTRASTGSTQGGEAGWSDALLAWDNPLPGGGWTQKEIITSTKATGLELTNTRTLTLLASDSNILVLARVVKTNLEDDHLHAGDEFQVVVTVIHASNANQVVVDAAPTFFLLRYNNALSRLEYLDGAFVWQSAVGATFTSHTTAQSPSDPKSWIFTFTSAQTADWGETDLLGIIGRVKVNSTPYISDAPREVLGRANPHSHNEFDPTGLFK